MQENSKEKEVYLYFLLDLVIRKHRWRGIASHLELRGQVKVLVQSNKHRGREGQTQEGLQGVPVPMLQEHHNAHCAAHLHEACPGLHAHHNVSTSRVEDAAGKDSAGLGQDGLVLVVDHAHQKVLELLHGGRARFGGLLQHQGLMEIREKR